MRKLKLQIQVSLDGFVAGPNGEQDWMIWNWDDVLNQYVKELTDSTGTMLIGRVTYQGMEHYWPSAAANSDASTDEIGFANRMNEIEKVVFSHTLSTVDWNNSRLAGKNSKEEVLELKQQTGKDLIIYGGAGLVSSFIQQDLIDEYHLFVNPVLLGTGMPIWKEMERKNLQLIKTTTSSVGIVILYYQPA